MYTRDGPTVGSATQPKGLSCGSQGGGPVSLPSVVLHAGVSLPPPGAVEVGRPRERGLTSCTGGGASVSFLVEGGHRGWALHRWVGVVFHRTAKTHKQLGFRFHCRCVCSSRTEVGSLCTPPRRVARKETRWQLAGGRHAPRVVCQCGHVLLVVPTLIIRRATTGSCRVCRSQSLTQTATLSPVFGRTIQMPHRRLSR